MSKWKKYASIHVEKQTPSISILLKRGLCKKGMIGRLKTCQSYCFWIIQKSLEYKRQKPNKRAILVINNLKKYLEKELQIRLKRKSISYFFGLILCVGCINDRRMLPIKIELIQRVKIDIAIGNHSKYSKEKIEVVEKFFNFIENINDDNIKNI